MPKELHQLQEFSPLTAAGPDGFHPIILKKGWGSIGDANISIAKVSYQLGYTPTQWRNSTATGIFQPKPGKDDYHSPKFYRTIILSSVLLRSLNNLAVYPSY